MSRTQSNPDSEDVAFTLTIRALKSDVPVFIRLRRVLKSLLRTYSFQCTYYTMTPTPIQFGHGGQTATLSRTTTPATNSTLEDGSRSSVAATPVADTTGVMPDGQSMNRLFVQRVQGVKLGDASECRAS